MDVPLFGLFSVVYDRNHRSLDVRCGDYDPLYSKHWADKKRKRSLPNFPSHHEQFTDYDFEQTFRFSKTNMHRLYALFEFLDEFQTSWRAYCTGMEGLLIVLYRLSNPGKWTQATISWQRTREVCHLDQLHAFAGHTSHFIPKSTWSVEAIFTMELSENVLRSGSSVGNFTA